MRNILALFFFLLFQTGQGKEKTRQILDFSLNRSLVCLPLFGNMEEVDVISPNKLTFLFIDLKLIMYV